MRMQELVLSFINSNKDLIAAINDEEIYNTD
jgi:hypothetical protein